MARTDPAPPSRFATVDVLRAIACLSVVVYHAVMWVVGAANAGWEATWTATPRWLWPVVVPARLGFLGVSLFLVLSGFCLYVPVVSRAHPRGAPLDLARFFGRRVVRTMPPYWASIAAIALALQVPGLARINYGNGIRARDLVTHLTMTHNLLPDTIWSINGVYWTLALEWQLYVVFPLAVLIVRRFGLRAFLPLALAVSLAWPAWLRSGPLGSATGGVYAVWFESVPERCFEFAAGMAVAALVKRGVRAPRAALAVVALAWIPAAWYVHVVDVWAFPIDRVLCGAGFASLLWLFVDTPALAAGAIGRAFVAVGAFSYSLYLVHQPVMLGLAPLVDGLEGAPRVLASLLGVVPLAVLASWLFYRAFEVPVLRLLAAKPARGAPSAA